jgi:hypothetical protein
VAMSRVLGRNTTSENRSLDRWFSAFIVADATIASEVCDDGDSAYDLVSTITGDTELAN